MRIIDLLNKIANKEELPQQIKIYDEKLRLNENKDNYLYEESDEYYGDEFIHWFNLNTEVEIIEDKEIIKDKEIERLNNIINQLNNAYCKVITKCEEMIDSRFYMNDIAIKKYADEIKDICKYYVGEAKIKKENKNEYN